MSTSASRSSGLQLLVAGGQVPLVYQKTNVFDSRRSDSSQYLNNPGILGARIGPDVDLSRRPTAHALPNCGWQLLGRDLARAEPNPAVTLNRYQQSILSKCSSHRYGVSNLCQVDTGAGQIWTAVYQRNEHGLQGNLVLKKAVISMRQMSSVGLLWMRRIGWSTTPFFDFTQACNR
jgi:hypothetical protein